MITEEDITQVLEKIIFYFQKPNNSLPIMLTNDGFYCIEYTILDNFIDKAYQDITKKRYFIWTISKN